MPWRTKTIMDERARFVFEAEHADLSFSELCRRYGISRPTGYKWLARFGAEGVGGLGNRSHRPHACPHAVNGRVERRIVELRKRRGWGAPKLRRLLEDEFGDAPSVSTIHRVLARHDLVRRRRPRRRRDKPERSPFTAERPNELWTADFKGQFRLLDGTLCYPLTVQDAHSRFLLECRALESPTVEATRRAFLRLFHTYGLPERIRTDNGQPFASFTSLARLSQLSVWWIEHGITPELIQPGKPQQNGRHERMHRTLKREATRPPRPSLDAQQRAFNQFRAVFNTERPHQALGQRTPASLYRPSSKPYDPRAQRPRYPAHFEVRLASQIGNVRWNTAVVWVSSILARKHLGFEQIADALWAVYFGPVHIGWLDESQHRIIDVRETRRKR